MSEEERQRWEGDGLDPEDMQIPEVKLIQNVGGSVAKAAGAVAGDFYCSLTDEIIKGADGFEMVVVAMQKNRTYWGRDDILDDPPSCASLHVTRTGGESINGENCAECEHRNEAPWLLTREQRRSKCLLNYNIIGINMEGLPVLMRMSGISAAAAKELYTQLSLNRTIKGKWYQAKTHVMSVARKSAAGEAFAVRFGKLQLIEDPQQLEELKSQSEGLLGTQITLPEHASEAPEEKVTPPALAPEEKVTQPTSAEEKKPEEKKPEEKVAKAEPPIDMDF